MVLIIKSKYIKEQNLLPIHNTSYSSSIQALHQIRCGGKYLVDFICAFQPIASASYELG